MVITLLFRRCENHLTPRQRRDRALARRVLKRSKNEASNG